MSFTTELLIVLGLIIVNGVFAMSEIAIVSARKIRLKKMADEGDTRAEIALLLANSPNRFLSTVQVGITLIGIVAGAFGGARLSLHLQAPLEQIAATAPYAEAISVAVVVTTITFLSLVIGELVPKRIGLNNPIGISLIIAKPMNFLARLSKPVVHILGVSTNLLIKILGIKKDEEPPVSEDEVRTLIEQGVHAGVFRKDEIQMVEGVFRLDDLYVDDIMTVRARMVWLNVADDDEINWRKIVSSGHSNFPVYEGNRDNVLGMVKVKALWANKALAGDVKLRDLVTDPLYVPFSMPVDKLLQTFKRTRHHVALVTDEYGSSIGLVTLIDVLEAIVGVVPSADQHRRPGAHLRDDGSWLCDALMSTSDLKKLLHVTELPDEEEAEYQTLAGFILNRLGHIPTEGDKLEYAKHQFEIMDMDRQRVDKVLITPMEKLAPNPED